MGPALLMLKVFQLKAFGGMLVCDWLMLKHKPITAKISDKAFSKKSFSIRNREGEKRKNQDKTVE